MSKKILSKIYQDRLDHCCGYRASCFWSPHGTRIHITEQEDTTSCNFVMSNILIPRYVTESCTNWDPLSGDDVLRLGWSVRIINNRVLRV